MNSSSLTITCLILLTCLIWMDACLYFQIQSIDDEETSNNNNNQAQTNQPAEDYKTHQSSSSANHNGTRKSFMRKFSFAFQGMSVKLMMTDPVDNYLLAPLSEALVDLVNFKDNLWFITPNMVSYAGVVSAVIAGKLVSHDSSTLHKLSFVLFQLRTWLDDLDGAVARTRMGIVKHVSLQSTPGYVIDGVCDAIGFIAYILGCYIFLKNTIRRSRRMRSANRYNLQSITEIKSSSPSTYIPLKQNSDERDRLKNASDIEFNPIHDEVDDDDDEEVHFNTMSDFNYDNDSNSKSLLSNDEDESYQSTNRNEFARSKIFLKRKIQNGKQSSVIFYRYIKEKIKDNLSNRKLVLVTLCFLLQLAMCATFWNRYILVYRDLLESPSETSFQARQKSKILKSNIMYIIIWFWRITNGHSMMQMLIASVFIGKLWQFLDFIKYIGFVEIILLATVTELHIIDVRNYLSILP